MKERLFFEVGEGKKDLLEALKNELKISKKILIKDYTGDTIASSIKYDVYKNYIDFYLDEPIEDYKTEVPGKIQKIVMCKEDYKGTKYLKIKSVIA